MIGFLPWEEGRNMISTDGFGVLDLEGLYFWICGEDFGFLDLGGGGRGVPDDELIILAFVLNMVLRGKVVLVGAGRVVDTKDEGFLEFMALEIFILFELEASSSPFLLCLKVTSSSFISCTSSSSSCPCSFASTLQTTFAFPSCFVFILLVIALFLWTTITQQSVGALQMSFFMHVI